MTTLQFTTYETDFLCDTDNIKKLRYKLSDEDSRYIYSGEPLPDCRSNTVTLPIGLNADANDVLMCEKLINTWKQAGYPPARFEFLHTDNEQGVLVFNVNDKLLFHAVNANLGYNGNGPNLSRAIMKASGFLDDDFDTVNKMCLAKPTYRLGVAIVPVS